MTPHALLGGARPEAGVLRWATGLDADYVAGVVRRADGVFAALPAGAGADLPAFHRAIAGALGFPDYYGHNLDALHDCLSDLPSRSLESPESPGVPVVWWDDWESLASAEPRTFPVLVDLLGSWVCLVLRSRPTL